MGGKWAAARGPLACGRSAASRKGSNQDLCRERSYERSLSTAAARSSPDRYTNKSAVLVFRHLDLLPVSFPHPVVMVRPVPWAARRKILVGLSKGPSVSQAPQERGSGNTCCIPPSIPTTSSGRGRDGHLAEEAHLLFKLGLLIDPVGRVLPNVALHRFVLYPEAEGLPRQQSPMLVASLEDRPRRRGDMRLDDVELTASGETVHHLEKKGML